MSRTRLSSTIQWLPLSLMDFVSRMGVWQNLSDSSCAWHQNLKVGPLSCLTSLNLIGLHCRQPVSALIYPVNKEECDEPASLWPALQMSKFPFILFFIVSLFLFFDLPWSATQTNLNNLAVLLQRRDCHHWSRMYLSKVQKEALSSLAAGLSQWKLESSAAYSGALVGLWVDVIPEISSYLGTDSVFWHTALSL